MKKAIIQSYIAYAKREVPVGCVIVKNDTIISSAHNKIRELNNPIMHAEIIAINEACKNLKSRYLNECEIYVTVEPCHMCYSAISLARIEKIFYASQDLKFGGIENEFFLHRSEQTCYKKPKIYGNILGKESSQIMRFFFKDIRYQNNQRKN